VRAQDAYRQLYVRTCGRERKEVRVARDSHSRQAGKTQTVGGHGAVTRLTAEETARQHRPPIRDLSPGRIRGPRSGQEARGKKVSRGASGG
jgi:hypothetical protein